jgi:hypothetical protein
MALEVSELKVQNKIIVGTQELTSAVTSVGGTGTVAGLTLSGTVTTTGNLTLGGTLSTPVSTINDSTTVGQNLVKLANPSAIRFIRINANNTVDALTDANFRTAIGAGTSSTGGTVTSVGITAGTGISVSGSPVTGSGSITVTNSSPDQTVALTGAGTVSVSGTYPNFTITGSGGASGDFLPLTGGTLTGNLNISNTGPVITLKDSDSTGNAQLGYISFQDSTNTEKGWLGFGSSGNTNFTISNEYSGGFINLLGGNVGIGTDSPSNILQVRKNQTSDTAVVVSNNGTPNANTTMSFILQEDATPQGWFRRYRDGTGRTEIGYSDILTFSGAVTGTKVERMRIASGGNIGIGTPSPSTILNVVTGSNADGIQIRRNTSITTANDFATLGFRIDTVPNQANTAEIRGLRTNRVNLGDTDLVFTTSTSGFTPTEKMRIRDDGNVGIGTDSPSAKLDVNGGFDVRGNIRLTGTATTTNQSRTIEFTGFDKEGTTDFSDNAYIRHTVNSGGLTGSVLEISSQNDAEDGINFLTSSSNNFRHNGSVIITGNNIGSQSVNYASSSGNADTVDGYHETAFVRLSANSSSPTNGAFAIGNASSRNFIQSHNGQPLDINPLGNNVILNSGAGSVGIGGTTSFAEKLNIEGRIKLNGPGASFILFATENTNRGYVYIDNSSRMGFLSSGGGWIWQISNSGLLQVGTVPYARTTGVAATDSTNTVSGGLRSRIIGSTLYLTNNGTTAG